MNSDPALEINGLSKRYHLGSKHLHDNLREALAAFFKHSRRKQAAGPANYIWALQGLNLSVQRGEVVGIIGRNGSGKSTLLKLISRITSPTTGTIKISGRVSSLLDIGMGFHPDLTGRENIFLNGAILGMRRAEILAKFDDIVTFSGIDQKFLDTPVKRYSSGMYVRLAFSIAAHLESDILLVDEVLAVGDQEFQQKCLRKMDRITESRRTILFVSHNLSAIEKLCQRTIILNAGEKVFDGAVNEAIQYYHKLISPPNRICDLNAPEMPRSGDGRMKFEKLVILNPDGIPKKQVRSGDTLIIQLDIAVAEGLQDPFFAIFFRAPSGQTLFRLHSRDSEKRIPPLSGNRTIACQVPNLPLLSGKYYLSLWAGAARQTCDFVEYAYELNVLPGDLHRDSQRADARYAGHVYIPHSWDFHQTTVK